MKSNIIMGRKTQQTTNQREKKKKKKRRKLNTKTVYQALLFGSFFVSDYAYFVHLRMTITVRLTQFNNIMT